MFEQTTRHRKLLLAIIAEATEICRWGVGTKVMGPILPLISENSQSRFDLHKEKSFDSKNLTLKLGGGRRQESPLKKASFVFLFKMSDPTSTLSDVHGPPAGAAEVVPSSNL